MAALATALAVAASACGQARLATPPAPQFTSGQRAEPTVVVDVATASAGSEPILIGDIESGATDAEFVDVDRMVIIDDAGNAAPNRSGWQAFDESLGGRLLPSDTSASVAVTAAVESTSQIHSTHCERPTAVFKMNSASQAVTVVVASGSAQSPA